MRCGRAWRIGFAIQSTVNFTKSLTVLDKSVKSKLNRNPGIEYNHFPTIPQDGKTIVGFQKRRDRLTPCRSNDFLLIAHRIYWIHHHFEVGGREGGGSFVLLEDNDSATAEVCRIMHNNEYYPM
jgi:hypothetical protein